MRINFYATAKTQKLSTISYMYFIMRLMGTGESTIQKKNGISCDILIFRFDCR